MKLERVMETCAWLYAGVSLLYLMTMMYLQEEMSYAYMFWLWLTKGFLLVIAVLMAVSVRQLGHIRKQRGR